jgi:hypothetical protein
MALRGALSSGFQVNRGSTAPSGQKQMQLKAFLHFSGNFHLSSFMFLNM